MLFPASTARVHVHPRGLIRRYSRHLAPFGLRHDRYELRFKITLAPTPSLKTKFNRGTLGICTARRDLDWSPHILLFMLARHLAVPSCSRMQPSDDIAALSQ